MNETVVVITGADAIAPATALRIPDGAVLIAADGALDHALAAGLLPAGLVGDMDSISAAGLEWAARHATIERHDPDKDQTDTELALLMAAELRPARLILVGAGDRLDHVLAAIGALGQPHLTSIPVIDAWWDEQWIRVLHGPGARRSSSPRAARSRCWPSTARAAASRSPACDGRSNAPISRRLSASA